MMFNELSDAETERLDLLAEEAAEVIVAVSKIKRHGYESKHPNGGPTNRVALMMELGHLTNAKNMMISAKDISQWDIGFYSEKKAEEIHKYLHHQKGE